jgi:hypothetical protein
LAFIVKHLKQILGGDCDHSPVTLDLNGQVDPTAAGDERSRALRVRLSLGCQKVRIDTVFLGARLNTPAPASRPQRGQTSQPRGAQRTLDKDFSHDHSTPTGLGNGSNASLACLSR